MSKKSAQSVGKKNIKIPHLIHPWRCEHADGQSKIMAYVEISSSWETIAVVHRTSGAKAEQLADFITHLINNNQKYQDLLREAVDALKAVVNDGLNFSTEQAADSVIERMRKS